ncbi:MAG: hypothetical protein L0211_21795 [Planctomycetaceae bacterium]|nr:hypothetical protein [Planctomycetaceae bacterium]
MSTRFALAVIVSIWWGLGNQSVLGDENEVAITDEPSLVPANTHYKLTRVGKFERIDSPDTTKTYKTEMAVSLINLKAFANGVTSLGAVARHNAARMESVYSRLPEQYQGLRMEGDDIQKVRIFLDFRPAKEQPREGFRFYVVPAVSYTKVNKGHLSASPPKDNQKHFEIWLYKDGKFTLERAASNWSIVIL